MCGGGLGPNNSKVPLLGPPTSPVAEKYQQSVIAMIQMGDPRFMPNKTFNVGTAKHEGVRVFCSAQQSLWIRLIVLTSSFHDQEIYPATPLPR